MESDDDPVNGLQPPALQPPQESEMPEMVQQPPQYGRGSKKRGNHSHRKYECAKRSKVPKCVVDKKRKKQEEEKWRKQLTPGQLLITNNGDRLKVAYFQSVGELEGHVMIKHAALGESYDIRVQDIAAANFANVRTLTPGTPIMIMGDFFEFELRYALFLRYSECDKRVWVTLDDSGLEFHAPEYECYELPNFTISPRFHLDIVSAAAVQDTGLQNALKLFSCMIRRLQKENALLSQEYREKSMQIEEEFKNDVFQRDVMICSLKEQHLEDIETIQRIDQMWQERWGKMGANTQKLYELLHRQNDLLQEKDNGIVVCRKEIETQRETLKLQQICAAETEKRLRSQIHALKSRVDERTKLVKTKDSQVAAHAGELNELQSKLRNNGIEMQALQCKLKQYNEKTLMEVQSSCHPSSGDKDITARDFGSSKRKSHYVKVPQPNISSSNANFRSLSERSLILRKVLHLLSASTHPTDEDIVATLTHFISNNPDITLEACKNAKLVSVNKLAPGECVDLKVMLKLPMNRFRDLRTFLTNHGIHILSNEQLMRDEMNERVPVNSLVEVGIMMLYRNGGSEAAKKLTSVAFCRVRSLDGALQHILKKHEKDKVSELGVKFKGELWWKLGGDKGGTTTKLVMQLANLDNPNAPEKTELLGLFEAYDSNENLWKVFSPLRDEMAMLDQQVRKVKHQGGETDFTLRLFLFGDYMWLANVLGHQGPSSSFPCIFCHAPLQDLRDGKGKPHTPMMYNTVDDSFEAYLPCSYTKRDNQTYQNDLAGFLNDTRNPNDKKLNGKYHHSVIHDMLFHVNIDQVVPPPLHIFLGLVKSCYEMVENQCIVLDRESMGHDELEEVAQLYEKWKNLSIQVEEADIELLNAVGLCSDVQNYIDSIRKNRDKPRHDDNRECCSPVCVQPNRRRQNDNEPDVKWVGCDSCESWVHFHCSGLPKADIETLDDDAYEYKCYNCRDIDTPAKLISYVQTCVDRAAENKKNVKEHHTKMHAQLNAAFAEVQKHQGPRELELVRILEKDLLVVKQAYHSQSFIGNHCKKIISHADELLKVLSDLDVFGLYRELFQRLNKIHSLASVARFLTGTEIKTLSEECWKFGQWYPVNFKEASVTIKFHMLVFHVPEFVQKWNTLGLMSEHGAESIHRLINSDQRTYSCVRDPAEQFRLIYQSHSLRTTANSESLKPKSRLCSVCPGRIFLKTNKKTKEKACPKCYPDLF